MSLFHFTSPLIFAYIFHCICVCMQVCIWLHIASPILVLAQQTATVTAQFHTLQLKHVQLIFGVLCVS